MEKKRHKVNIVALDATRINLKRGNAKRNERKQLKKVRIKDAINYIYS